MNNINDIQKLHKQLLAWYARHGRHDLPWRCTKDPYAIYISEVMLQQTQVSTVLARFYSPFLKRFPTLKHLAEAPRAAVMKHWEGLGYYRRAAHLHEAAQQASPSLPVSVEALMALPGIGRNTAHAVMAFAHRHPVPVLEANVKRVVARFFALHHPKDAELWDGAWALLNADDPFNHNQAMMDIGSQVCTPKQPQCGGCPLSVACKGRENPGHYPGAKVRKVAPVREVALLVRESADGCLYLIQRQGAFLTGLWGFPECSEPSKRHKKIGVVKHVYSHFTLLGTVYYERVSRSQKGRKGWIAKEAVDALALAGVDKKIIRIINVLNR